jgi:hypothetical protein
VERINLRDATEQKPAKPPARDGRGHLRTVNKGKNHPAKDEEDINTPCAVGSDRAEVEPGSGVADVKVKERDPKRRESSDSGKRINPFQLFSSMWRDDEAGCRSNRDAPFDAAGGRAGKETDAKFELLAAMLLKKKIFFGEGLSRRE